MSKVKNKNVFPRTKREAIIKVKLPGISALHTKFLEGNVVDVGACWFKNGECFMFARDVSLIHKLAHVRPDKQRDFAQFTDSKYSSFIVYKNKIDKLVTIDHAPEFNSVFKMLEERISECENIRMVDYYDLTNADKSTYDSRCTHIKQTGGQSVVGRSGVEKKTWKDIDGNLHKRKRKVEPPRPLDENKKSVNPFDGVDSLLPHFPYQESTPGPSEQVTSGYLPTSYNPFRTDTTQETGSHSSIREFGGSQSDRSASSRPVPSYPAYSNFATRKETFARWNRRYPSASDFTNAGFFFTDDVDVMVRCFHCGIGLRDITPETNPLLEHVKYSRECPFLKESLGSELLNQQQEQMQQQNHREEFTYTGRSLPYYSRHRHPDYRLHSARLATFDSWPSTHGQTPEQLADAGLFYTGYDDLVRCFSCDGGLRRWEPDDNPWIEHCRWFPTCPYAIEVKGEQFIAMVIAASHDVNEDTGAASGQTTNPAMNVLTAKSPVVQAILNEHRATIVEMMGFDENDFEEAVLELKKRDATTSVEDILEIIEINKDRKAKEEEFKILKEEIMFKRTIYRYVICVCD
ncbi:hypothetical protein ACF0H5_016240 [Mactra antiquata]